MITTALKIDLPQETQLQAARPAITKPSWLKRFLGIIVEATKSTLHPSLDIDAWRRIEYKNEFKHERRQYRVYWGH